ncbi:MAG: hypothetical protein H0U96_09740 [Acidobacteria bacterium]|jgi:hypothetical protein|nr:hypothetical protein [Acidobacteriota bacterium]
MKKNNHQVIKNLLIVLIAITAFFAVARAQEKTPAAVPTPMPTPQKLSAEITAVLNKLSCVSFEWVPWKGFSDKGGIRVPIKYGGKNHWFQLDTGADATIIYGQPDKSLNWKETRGQKWTRLTDVEFSGMKFPVARFYNLPNMPSEPGFIEGTIGLDLFMGNVAVIDFPGKRLCLMPQADAPTEFVTKSQSAKALIRDGKFFIVNAKINGQKVDGLFYDTGASATALGVDFEVWKIMTGNSGEEQAGVKAAGYSWGKPMNFIGAETKGEFEIGNIKLGKQLAFYRSQPVDFFKKFPIEATGTIGNVPFLDKVIVLDLGIHPALRILK